MISIASVYFENKNLYPIYEGQIVDKLMEYMKSKVKNNKNYFKKVEHQIDKKSKEIHSLTGADLTPIQQKVKKSAEITARKTAQNIDSSEKLTSIIKTQLEEILDEMKQVKGIKTWAKSIVLLLAVFLFSLFIYVFLANIFVALGFSPLFLSFVIAVVVAPLLEESAKLFSIKEKITGKYFIVFNIVEFTQYVNILISGGMSLVSTILIRIPALIVHAATTLYQHSIISKKDNEYDLTVINKIKDRKALKGGILIHAIFNALAMGITLSLM